VRPCLPFRDVEKSLRDIADAIAMIETFTEGMELEAFREDPKTIAAVERKLQVISEAAVRLGETAEARCPGLPVAEHPWNGKLATSPVRAGGA
jgi:uncharacterized protein with HEPN domain